jgi:hypothetical protein
MYIFQFANDFVDRKNGQVGVPLFFGCSYKHGKKKHKHKHARTQKFFCGTQNWA